MNFMVHGIDKLNALNITLQVLMLLVFPLVLGFATCSIMRLDPRNICKCFSVGNFTAWALFELVALPIVNLKLSFTLLVIVASVLYLAVIVIGVFCYVRDLEDWRRKPWKRYKPDWYDILLFVILLAVIARVLFLFAAYTHTDNDDSRFMVNVIDILRTDKLFLINPATGNPIRDFAGELLRDIMSPWAAFQAYLAKLTLTDATILCHTIQPLYLVLLLFTVQWQLAGHVVGDRIGDKCLFCLIYWALIIFRPYNGWNAEDYILVRLWQGKSVVAGIAIPYFLYLLFESYKEFKWRTVILMAVVNVGMCLTSNMGVLFGGVLAGLYGLVYWIAKRNWRYAVGIWLTAVLNIILGIWTLLLMVGF